MKFKLGNVVRNIKISDRNTNCSNKLGKIVRITDGRYTVKFFEHINGHNGWGKGKDGYCWNFFKEEIELHVSILKIFLKEKQNES